ncbi:MAG: aromatic ring-hydroxylating dioxygenase subunit alpha [Paracoccaceae bacterium]
MSEHRHPESPLLDHCPETLPREAYLDAGWFDREMATVWARNWVCVGRLTDFAAGAMRPVPVGGASVIVARAADGVISAFHNACRHRGAEICAAEVAVGKLITCPYHAWAYAASDGRLVSTAHATPTEDFDKQAHGLRSVSHAVWNGFVFLNRSRTPGPLSPDLGVGALDNWPMDGLVTGHRHERVLACNWKVFWENYNECLHCPGIHPELCDMVPVYAKGIMSASEAVDWDGEKPPGNLKPGAQSWTMTGAPCGPVFAGLTAEQRQDGYTFVTFYPTAYVVAHVDYVRCVRLEPIGPQETRLVAEWYFSPETLAQPRFDAADVAAFAKIVLGQDGDAAEMNQRGIRSPSYRRGRLMPQEFDIHRYHNWVLSEMESQND